MSEFLKSALNYFNIEPSVISNDFIGQIVEVGTLKLRVKSLIAEGGFAFVYEAQDVNQGTLYALKRLFGADKEACNNIIREIQVHKQVSDHPNIVKFITASLVDRSKSTNGLAEYLLVTELCTGGPLLDYVGEPMDGETILKIFYQASQAIKHLHFQNPPINHRDIKIENFLLGADGLLKLCDFGSATTEIISPDPSWNANARTQIEEKIATFTTPMYRAPEQLDTWENRVISIKTDIWALGCILYFLCFHKHPFEDSAKLRIINGNYTVPSNTMYNCFHSIIKGCLQTNPENRFDISVVLERLAAISESLNWNVKGPIKLKPRAKPATPPAIDVKVEQPGNSVPEETRTTWYNDKLPPERPQPPKAARPPPPQVAQQPHQHQNPMLATPSNGLFSSLKGGAGSFFKNLKDTSSKVMQNVQQSFNKADLDISYITSRVMVMPCPSEGLESTYRTNHVENIKFFLESKYQPSKVSVYNFGPRSVPKLPPPIRTVEGSIIYFPAPPRTLSLRGLYSIVEDMYGFLSSDPKSVLIVESADGGKSVAATIVAALFVYATLITEPEDGIQMFAVKRIPPNIRPSELRYLYYLTDIVRSKPHLPHYKPVTLISLTISPVPRMTKARDGCRLFIEIICNDKIIVNTLDDYEKMRLYHCTEEKITLSLNTVVCGDVGISLYHARNTLAGMGGRPHGIKVCQLQFNTGYIPEQETLLSYDRQELDEITDTDQYLTNLNVSVSILVDSVEKPPAQIAPWLSGKPVQKNPKILFASDIEHHENVENFVTAKRPGSSSDVKGPPPRPAPPPPSPLLHSRNAAHSTTTVQPDLVQHTKEADKQTPPINETFDLLNLNQNYDKQTHNTFHIANPPQRPPPPQKEISFDLLGFGKNDDAISSAASLSRSSETLSNHNSSNIDLLDDNLLPKTSSVNLLGNLNLDLSSSSTSMNTESTRSQNFAPFENILKPNLTNEGKSQSNVAEPPKSETRTSNDPFADIGSFVSNFTTKFTSDLKQSQQTLFGGQPSSASNTPPRVPSQPNIIPTPSPIPSSHTTPTHQARSMQDTFSSSSQKPDYSRSHFGESSKDPKGQGAAAAAAAAAGGAKNGAAASGGGGGGGGGGGFGNMFADILGEQGYKFGNTSQTPKTINDMRKEDVIKEMDPERIKIMEWTEGKKGNIRALLCSMHTILWTEAKWTKCEMHQLVSMADVKKAYRKACLAVHPDKHVATENEQLSKMIFIELNNAWTDFEEDKAQQNLFQN